MSASPPSLPAWAGVEVLRALDDRAMHSVCDPVRELDVHVLEAVDLEAGDILLCDSAPAMQPIGSGSAAGASARSS